MLQPLPDLPAFARRLAADLPYPVVEAVKGGVLLSWARYSVRVEVDRAWGLTYNVTTRDGGTHKAHGPVLHVAVERALLYRVKSKTSSAPWSVLAANLARIVVEDQAALRAAIPAPVALGRGDSVPVGVRVVEHAPSTAGDATRDRVCCDECGRVSYCQAGQTGLSHGLACVSAAMQDSCRAMCNGEHHRLVTGR